MVDSSPPTRAISLCNAILSDVGISTVNVGMGYLGFSLVRGQDRFRLKESFEAVDTVFAADPGLLDTSERSKRFVSQRVHLHSADLHSCSDAQRSLHVGGKHVTLEAIRRIVCDGDRLFFIAVRQDREDRPEDFVLSDLHVVANVAEDGGAYEPAAVQVFGTALSSGNKAGACGNADPDVAL